MKGHFIPSVRLLSHQMIRLSHDNYSKWKIIKKNYVSVNEDEGLRPSCDVFSNSPAGSFQRHEESTESMLGYKLPPPSSNDVHVVGGKGLSSSAETSRRSTPST